MTRGFAGGKWWEVVGAAGSALLLAVAGGSLFVACGQHADAGSCATPEEGCPCTTGEVAECGTKVGAPTADSVLCSRGTRTCTGGAWGACVGNGGMAIQSLPHPTTKSTTASKCTDNPCDPSCKAFTDNSSDIDGGGAISTTDGGGITITSGDGSTGPTGACTGLECSIDPCGGDYTKTQLTGTVYDPAGKNPVYNVLVYVPNGTLATITDGVSCDSCVGGSGSPIVSTITGPDGKFTLKGVPNGTSIPLVMQVGKWRRQVNVPVTKCVSNALTDKNVTRLPKNRTEGSIPRIAFVSGNADPFQCVLSKMGIDVPNEVSGPYDSSGALRPQRIHYYNSYDNSGDDLATTNNGPGASASKLWDTLDHLKQYDVAILSCEGGQYVKDSTYAANMVSYANAGGRIFATHFSYVWLQYAAAASNWPNVVTQWYHSSSYTDPLNVTIDQSFTKGNALANWLVNVGASSTLGQLSISQPRRDYTFVDKSRATRWMTAWSNNSTGTGVPPGSGNSCAVDSDCSDGGLACAGYCTNNLACSSGGSACGGGAVTTTCTKSSQCKGNNSYCVSGGGNLCKVWNASKSAYVVNKCSSGKCQDGTTCAVDTDCGTRTKVCSTDSDCFGGGKCVASSDNVCAFDTGSSYVVGVCDGRNCAAKNCATAADCGSGETCTAGSCSVDHDMEPLMTFNTPVGAAAASQCGRVVYSDFHVSAASLSGTSYTFPTDCVTGDLSSQEKALEFMLFDLTSCITPDYVPPSSAPPYPSPVSVSRDYTATCGPGEKPVWRFFDWQTVTPGDSKIQFTVQTGDTTAALTSMTPLLLATVSGPPITTWTGSDVNALLSSQTPPVANGQYLRVNIKLIPSSDGTQAPTLTAWRQSYDCVATE